MLPNKLITRFILALALALTAFVGVYAEEKKVNIGDAKLVGNDFTVPHDSFTDLRFKKRIYDNPSRLVFDILGANLGNKVITYDLPERYGLKQVRLAQFDQDTVRVVIEGSTVTALEKVRIENVGRVLHFRFGMGNIKISDIAMEQSNLRVVAEGVIVPRTILLDNPTRLVVDIIGSELNSPLLAKSFTVGDEAIKVSQLDDSIVRIVFTGPKSNLRDVRISTNERQLLILQEGAKPAPEPQTSTISKLLSFKVTKSTPSETVFSLEFKGDLNYKFLKLHNPERLVVDLVDVNFDEALATEVLPETPHVKSTRFGLATLGRPVTRIVFDLKSADLLEEFRESLDKKFLYIRLQGGSKDKASLTDELGVPLKSQGLRVVLDAGHGGYDHGAIYGGHNEKDINLQVATRVLENLKIAGIDAYMTRNEDRFMSLSERVELSNTIEPKIFVSMHANALVTNPNMQGLQTYYHSDGGLKLAEYVHKRLVKDVGMPDQKIRKANFWVCKYTKAPSILLELGFMTNVEERNKLTRDSYQAELAKSISRGIIEYLEDH
jgi:N-acetylmuramoyl-L-alanine amidase